MDWLSKQVPAARSSTRPSDRPYAVWSFAEARWCKIQEIKNEPDKLRAGVSDIPEMPLITRCEPRCEGIGKVQTAIATSSCVEMSKGCRGLGCGFGVGSFGEQGFGRLGFRA